MTRRWWVWLCLLGACARAPVVSVEVQGVPADTATLEVWTWQGGVGAATPVRFPVEAARPTQRLGLRLGQDLNLMDRRGDVAVAVGALGKDGCLLGLGETSGIAGGNDLYLRLALSPTTGPCGTERPLLVSVQPLRTRTLAQEPLTVRGLGFQPDVTVQVGGQPAPGVRAISPMQIAGPLPALPGRVGPQDITVSSRDGARLATAAGALRLMLTELRLAPTLVVVDRNICPPGGWAVPLPRADGGADLVVSSRVYDPTDPTQRPAQLLSSLRPGRQYVDVAYFPARPGRVMSSAALDLDGDGLRREVVFASIEGYDNKLKTFAGPSTLPAYRVEGAQITALGPAVQVEPRLFGPLGEKVVGFRDVTALPALGADRRETVQAVLNPWLYEYRLDGGGLVRQRSASALGVYTGPVLTAALLPGRGPGLVLGALAFAAPGADPQPIVTGTAGCRDIAAGDIDGDGVPELGCTLPNPSLFIYPNQTPGGDSPRVLLGAPLKVACGVSPWGVSFVDLDGDGLSEVLCASYGVGVVGYYGELFLYKNVNGGLWRTAIDDLTFPPGQELIGFNIAVADFDGDGRTDLATTFNNDRVLILFNQSN